MREFKTELKPAFNPEQFARLTFLGTGDGTKAEKDGSIREFFKLIFEARSTTVGESVKVFAFTDYEYSVNNKLGKAMINMGFIPEEKEVKLVADSEGFNVKEVKRDAEGFEIVEPEEAPDVKGFLQGCIGNVYLAKLNKGDKYWNIEVDTLKPYVKA